MLIIFPILKSSNAILAFHQFSLQLNLAFSAIKERTFSPCKQICFWIWPSTMFCKMLHFMIANHLVKLNIWNFLFELFDWSPNPPGCFSCVSFCFVKIKFLDREGWGRTRGLSILSLRMQSREELFQMKQP